MSLFLEVFVWVNRLFFNEVSIIFLFMVGLDWVNGFSGLKSSIKLVIMEVC